MGMGDVKFAAVMGLFLGKSVAPGLFLAFGAGALVGVAMIVAQGSKARKKGVPFAPFLAFGAIVALLYGPEIIDWYERISGIHA
jgi:leader peptidase (prepilin peptidase)/N-methyltransferase